MAEPGPGTNVRACLHALDLAVYRAVAETRTPVVDAPLRRLSTAADRSRLSLACAVGLAAAGGPRGRRAAVMGLASIAVASACVNLGGKLLTRRDRPDRKSIGVPLDRHIPMPASASFPSGHSAAAVAFATGVSHAWPAASVPLFGLAAAVAYSRVHTGVHYPSDVLAGVFAGLGSGLIGARGTQRLWPT